MLQDARALMNVFKWGSSTSNTIRIIAEVIRQNGDSIQRRLKTTTSVVELNKARCTCQACWKHKTISRRFGRGTHTIAITSPKIVSMAIEEFGLRFMDTITLSEMPILY